MIHRNRVPTIFSIYMVDVLCCALGCVVLLWQVNFQEAEEKTAAAASSLQDLDKANRSILALSGELESLKYASRHKLDQANQTILALSGELDDLKTSLISGNKKYLQIAVELDKTRKDRDAAVQLALVRKQEFDLLKKNHAAAEALLASTKLDLKELQTKTMLTAAQLADKLKANAAAEALILSLKLEVKDLQTKSTLTAAQLVEKIKAHADLLDKIAKSDARIVLLAKDVDAKKLELLLANRKLDEQYAKLKTADARLTQLDKDLTDVRGEGKDAMSRLKIADLRIKLLEQDGVRGKSDLADAKRRLEALLTDQDTLSRRLLASSKDLSAARAMISSLEGEKISLQNRARNIQAAMENRFAGVTLTGKQVVFLVDMSGSMELTDENTLDPDKWPLVCETIGRIMQSLTDLQRFQIILFSDRFLYPLRGDGRWIDYAGPAQAKQVVAELKAVKPKGGTDMYAALAEAFRFRAHGLDTIYLLSDGLPNIGEGMPANASKLGEQQITEALVKHVRQKLKSDWNRYVPGQPRVRINSIGFFFESPDVGAFLWALSREHDGSFVGMSK